jgi:predicted metalloprotease
MGHHVQTLLALQMRQMQEGKVAEANKLSVALELQADFYAGFGRITTKMNNFLEDEALMKSAAHAVGDDAIQAKIQGHIVPESFTHGTSAQRKHGL